jgi:hypothetical protein
VIDHIVLLTKTWRIVKEEALKPSYQKAQNFLNLYIERNTDEKDLNSPYELENNVNLITLGENKIPLTKKNLLEFYDITFAKFTNTEFSQLIKDNQEMLSVGIFWHFNAELSNFFK